jgi:hypothetical protein
MEDYISIMMAPNSELRLKWVLTSFTGFLIMNSDLKKIKKNLRYYRTRYTLQFLVNIAVHYLHLFLSIFSYTHCSFCLFSLGHPPSGMGIICSSDNGCMYVENPRFNLFSSCHLHESSAIIEKRSLKPHMLPGIALELEKRIFKQFVRETFRSLLSNSRSFPEKVHSRKHQFFPGQSLRQHAL